MAKKLRTWLPQGVLAAALVAGVTSIDGREPDDDPAPGPSVTSIPGGRVEDSARAVNDPHEYAWRLFLALCRQARPGTAGVPDSGRPTIREYDPDQPVVWETWALASGGRAGPVYVPPNRSEVYRDRGVKPPTWDALPRDKHAPKVLRALRRQGAGFLPEGGPRPGPIRSCRGRGRRGDRGAHEPGHLRLHP